MTTRDSSTAPSTMASKRARLQLAAIPVQHLIDRDRQADIGDDVDVERLVFLAIDSARPAWIISLSHN
jgi:hypothetical protein